MTIETEVKEIIEMLPSLSTAKLHALETRIATEHFFRFANRDNDAMEPLKKILHEISEEFKRRESPK